ICPTYGTATEKISTRNPTTTRGDPTPGLRTAAGRVQILPASDRDGRAKCRLGPPRTTLSAPALYPWRFVPAGRAAALKYPMMGALLPSDGRFQLCLAPAQPEDACAPPSWSATTA